MKKYLLGIIAVLSLFMVGCGKETESSIIKDLTKNIENSKAYHVTGVLEMINNENSYLYDVNVDYEKEDNFRVSLKNQTNNHEQIILRNSQGVYVLTPTLNKSFKFQSEWPYNNSQSYLLQSILKDIKNDKDRKFTKNDKEYIFTTKVTYSNNPNLVKQKITLDKSLNIKKVEVLNSQDQLQMKMTFTKIDLKATYSDNHFELKENINTTDEQKTEENTVSKIDDIIYPMYIPENTNLASQDKIKTTSGERVILSFSGDKPFMFIQETVSKTDELVTIPVNGEPVLFADTVGALTETSINWTSNGLEYYLVSDVLSNNELLEIAKSISAIPVIK